MLQFMGYCREFLLSSSLSLLTSSFSNIVFLSEHPLKIHNFNEESAESHTLLARGFCLSNPARFMCSYVLLQQITCDFLATQIDSKESVTYVLLFSSSMALPDRLKIK